MGKRGNRRRWPALALGAAGLAAAAAWVCLGSVTRTVSLQGIAFPQSGIRRVVAWHGGAVQQVLCRVGDTVERGDLLAVLPREDLLEAMRRGDGTEETWGSYVEDSLIQAPVSGKISRVAAVGEVLAVGGSLAEIIEDDPFTSQSELRAYVPAEVAAGLLEGMEVQVTPQAASRVRDGFYSGFISRIGVFPRSRTQVGEELSGFQAPWGGGAEENLIEVRVSLVGAPELDTGTLCELTVVQRRATPLELLLGAWG